jgi:hypothetical protein
METRIEGTGRKMREMDLAELEAEWQHVKSNDRDD